MSGDCLYGRDGEQAAIAGALDAVARGGRRLLVVRGEAGIGKTRLLAHLGERARAQRFVVREGRATELEQDAPFVPVADALAGAARDAGARAALGPELVAALDGILADAGPRAAVPATTERWRIHRAIGELLAADAADRPLVLVIDDAHWADAATQELLDHLVRRPPCDSLLLAVGARPGPAADRLLEAQRASDAVGLVFLDVRPLERTDADPLLAGVARPQDRDRLFALAGGNPLLLTELARDGGLGDLPGGVLAAVGADVARLPADARALVQAAAVVGDPFALDLAANVAGLDPAGALVALDAAQAAGLVRATSGSRRFAFRHPVVRTAVHDALGPGARLAAHAAAAEALARAGASDVAQASHLAHAAVPGDAVAAATLRSAAADVRFRVPGTAARWLTAARRADPAGTDVGMLAQTLVEAGRLVDALDVVDETRAAAQSARTVVAAASVERTLGRHEAARRRLEHGLRTLPGGSPGAALLTADLAVAAYQRGDYAETGRWARQVELTESPSPVTRAVAATLLAVGDVFAGVRVGAPTSLDAVLAALADASDEELAAAAEPAMAISWGLLALDRVPEGLAVSRRFAEAGRRTGNGVGSVPHDLAAVLALGLLGRLREAEPAADEAEQAARMSANPQLLQWAQWLRAWILMERGALDGAFAAARESVDLAAELDDSASAVVARAVLGAASSARGEHARGRALLAAYDIDHGWICRWAPSLVESDLADGDLEAAREHAERAATLAPATGMAGARAAAGRAQALVALADGDAAGAAVLAGAAAECAAAAGAALEAARGRLLFGRALLATDRDAAVAQLTAASQAAERCGAQRVQDEARRALRQAGVRVGRGGQRGAEGTDGLAALSAREAEIAGLVAEGLTNREIGARLFLSAKTVETHLTHVFQKLGLRSRTQVAAAVASAAQAPAAP